MSVRGKFPQQRPTLNLNFAQSKILDPRITFTRTSTATYVDEDGFIKTANNDVARFDHDPVTGECLGLLIEEQRSNLVTYSEKIGGLFSSYGWQNQNSITVDVDTTDVSDPSGGNSASKLTNGSSSPVSQTLKTCSLSATVYTASVYLRTLSGTETASINVFLQSSPYTTIANSGDLTITSEWRRYDIITSTATSADYNLGIQVRSGTIYAWGAQLEQGDFVTSVIPTSGSTVTRNPDNAYIEGTQFNQFYNLSEGSVFCSFSSPTPYGRTNASPFVFSINRNTIGWGHYVSSGGSSISLFRDPSDVNIAFLNTAGSPTVVTTDQIRKLSVGYKLDDFVQYVNVGNGVISERTDPSGQVRTDINAFAFNPQHSGLQRFGGHIQKFVYYPTKFSNTQIRNLAL